MHRATEQVFIDTNMLLFATQYHRDDVFSWFNKLYGNIWVHIDVLEEILIKRQRVQEEINANRWHLFDPFANLSAEEQIVYNAYVTDIRNAFSRLNDRRAASGQRVKNTANTGEISTLAVCLTIDAHLICSNDFDIRDVVIAENYTFTDDENNERLIVQDTAEDFCFHCVLETDITKAQVRRFYKTLYDNANSRRKSLALLDQRLEAL